MLYNLNCYSIICERMKTKQTILIICMMFMLVATVSAIDITTFTNGKNSENLTFTPYQYYTRYINIPKYININSAYFNIKQFGSTNNVTQCTQDQANVSGSCGIYTTLKGGSYFSNPSYKFYSSPYYYKSFDGNILTYPSTTSYLGDSLYMYYNVSKIVNQTRLILITAGGTTWNISIPYYCRNLSSNYSIIALNYNIYTAGGLNYGDLHCYNYNTKSIILVSNVLAVSQFREDYVEYYFESAYNPTVFVGTYTDTQNVWKYKGFYNTTTKVNFTKLVSTASTCSCTGCTNYPTYCTVPIHVKLNSTGTLEYSSLNVSYSLLQTNLTIYDGITNQLIDDKNVTIDIVGSSGYSTQLKTDTGKAYINLTQGDYNLIYYASGYPAVQRIISPDGYQSPIIYLYLTNYSSTVQVKLTVIDQYTNSVQNAQISVEKYIANVSAFKTQLDVTTTINGEATVSLIPENTLYRYVIYYGGDLVWNGSLSQGEIVGLSDTEYIFPIYLGNNVYEFEKKLKAISGTISLTNTPVGNVSFVNGTYTYTFNNPNTDEICFKIKKSGTIFSSIPYQQCTSSSTGTFSYMFSITESATYTATATITYNDKKYNLDSRTDVIIISPNNPFNKDTNYEGWFFSIILLAIGLFAFSRYPILGLILSELIFIILIKTRILQLGTSNQSLVIMSSVFVVAIIGFLIYSGDTD